MIFSLNCFAYLLDELKRYVYFQKESKRKLVKNQWQYVSESQIWYFKKTLKKAWMWCSTVESGTTILRTQILLASVICNCKSFSTNKLVDTYGEILQYVNHKLFPSPWFNLLVWWTLIESDCIENWSAAWYACFIIAHETFFV